VNSNSNKCDSGNATNGDANPSFVLYPNPVNGILYIDQNIAAMVTLEVFDFYGMPVESLGNTMLDGTNAPATHAIDMSGLEAGMYIIRLSTNAGVQVFSVVKD
jgi:hypothetical protein